MRLQAATLRLCDDHGLAATQGCYGLLAWYGHVVRMKFGATGATFFGTVMWCD